MDTPIFGLTDRVVSAGSTLSTVLVEVQDRFGNRVDYTYDNAWNARPRLTRIQASDGTTLLMAHINSHALGPALQSVGVTGYYYLFNAVPYVMTLVILVVTCAPQRVLRGAPSELGMQR
mgnify:CR=1 FL=1